MKPLWQSNPECLFLRIIMASRIDQSFSLNGRLHWRARKRRTDALRKAVALMFLGPKAKEALAQIREHLKTGLCLITLTRYGPALMDDDNNTSALKAVRDEVARQLQVDDGDKRLGWVCRQEKANWGLSIAIGPGRAEEGA